MDSKNTDNTNLSAKLLLRRHFLDRYHRQTPPRVFDCCQGSGVIWGELRKEYALSSYWGVDVKPKKGRLKIDSARILAQPGWDFDVIDVDTYGNPWKHYQALLPRVSVPLTLFLTIGSVANGPSSIASREELAALGLARLAKILPGSFTLKIIRPLSVNYLLTGCSRYAISIMEAAEAVSSGNARYLGMRLEKSRGPSASTPSPDTLTCEGDQHV